MWVPVPPLPDNFELASGLLASARQAPHFIMEPGWLVLLVSLFVQMFFTVLASRRGCD